jgi:hypothetical protein
VKDKIFKPLRELRKLSFAVFFNLLNLLNGLKKECVRAISYRIKIVDLFKDTIHPEYSTVQLTNVSRL